eukprot:4097848-Prymnesium_polylepis.1
MVRRPSARPESRLSEAGRVDDRPSGGRRLSRLVPSGPVWSRPISSPVFRLPSSRLPVSHLPSP